MRKRENDLDRNLQKCEVKCIAWAEVNRCCSPKHAARIFPCRPRSPGILEKQFSRPEARSATDSNTSSPFPEFRFDLLELVLSTCVKLGNGCFQWLFDGRNGLNNGAGKESDCSRSLPVKNGDGRCHGYQPARWQGFSPAWIRTLAIGNSRSRRTRCFGLRSCRQVMLYFFFS